MFFIQNQHPEFSPGQIRAGCGSGGSTADDDDVVPGVWCGTGTAHLGDPIRVGMGDRSAKRLKGATDTWSDIGGGVIRARVLGAQMGRL